MKEAGEKATKKKSGGEKRKQDIIGNMRKQEERVNRED